MYEIARVDSGAQITAYGGARDFVAHRGPEAILHGPAETGKTFTTLWKVHLCACKYPGASIVIARKVLNDVYSSIWITLRDKIYGDRDAWEWRPYGGSDNPVKINYTNGSAIWLAGFDRSGKVLSAEHDIIYINQVEECSLDNWETATTRTTGRAGNMPYSQTIGDANPAWPTHWMYHRESLRLFYSRHEENPALYDQDTGEITAQGVKTMAVLDNLTGVRKQRLRYGIPSRAEGVIYTDYDESLHLIYADKKRHFRRYVAGVDWGYSHAGVISVYGVTGDGVMYRVAEVYRSRQTDDWWLERARELNAEFKIEAFACDPAQPIYIKKFVLAGLNAVKANNAVLPGINAVSQRLSGQRLFFYRNANRYTDERLAAAYLPTCTEDELTAYVWAGGKREQPVKENDHGVDALRYAVMHVDNDRVLEVRKIW